MAESLYDADILIWSERQAELLRRLAAGERVNDDVDWANVIDEVESVGRSELNAVESLLFQALIHLLKLQAYPGSGSAPHWRGEARAFLSQAKRRFSPSMRTRIALADLHKDAVEAASAAYPEVDRWDPEACPFTLDELLGQLGHVAALLEPLGGKSEAHRRGP